MPPAARTSPALRAVLLAALCACACAAPSPAEAPAALEALEGPALLEAARRLWALAAGKDLSAALEALLPAAPPPEERDGPERPAREAARPPPREREAEKPPEAPRTRRDTRRARPLRTRAMNKCTGDVPVPDTLSAGQLDDWNALVALYDATNGPGWRANDCYQVSHPTLVCNLDGGANSTWYGVECDADGRVSGIRLLVNQLSGTLPTEQLRGLAHLRSFRAHSNSLRGVVPTDLHDLDRLEVVELNQNEFSGTLPADIGTGSLTTLDLSANHLSGTLPESWRGAGRLETLRVSFNALTGPFTGNFSGLGALTHLALTGNHLTGPLPSRVRGLGRLTELSASGNQLGGTLPEGGFEGMPALVLLDMQNNLVSGTVVSDWRHNGALRSLTVAGNRLEGTLPSRWLGADGIEYLHLDSNLISGTLPARWSGLESAKSVHMSSNLIEGTVVPSCSGLPALQQLEAAKNLLSGTVPAAWTDADALRGLDLGSNRLDGTVPVSWSGVPSLSVVNLGENQLSGTLPSRWDGLRNLSNLRLDANHLSGTLPARWHGVDKLVAIFAAGNAIHGTLPHEYEGLGALRILHVDENRLSGTLPANWTGLGHMRNLEVSHNLLSGSLPDAWGGLDEMSHLYVGFNRLSGPLPRVWRGMPELHSISAEGNALGGDFPPQLMQELPALRELLLSQNRLSSRNVTVESTPGTLVLLDVSSNELGGPLPASIFTPGLLFLVHNNSFDSFPSFDDPFSVRPPPQVDLSRNRLAGTLPGDMFVLFNDVGKIDLSHNRLTGSLPDSIADSSSLEELDVSFNRLEALSTEHLGHFRALRVLRAQNNRLRLADMWKFRPSEGSVLAELDLSDNPLGGNVGAAVRLFQGVFPQLTTLRLANCDLMSRLDTDYSLRLSTLDLSRNWMFEGFSADLEASVNAGSRLEVLDVSDTAYASTLGVASSLREYRRRNVSLDACLSGDVLVSNTLALVDVRGARKNFSPACFDRTLDLLEASAGRQRHFQTLGLTCPLWTLKTASRGEVVSDADFLLYQHCRCADNHAWDGAACWEVPAGLVATLAVDPFVVRPRHCVSGNVYPALRGGARLEFETASRSLAELHRRGLAMLPCRRPRLCSAVPCDEGLALEAHANPDVHQPLEFGCADGHDRDSMLCSRCKEGHWQDGDACLPCGSSYRVLVPLSTAVMLVLVGLVVWRKAARRSNGYRTLAIALFWLQVTSILEASSQVQGGNQSTSTWPWLSRVRSAMASVAVLHPWASECLYRGFDHVGRSYLMLGAPLGVAALAAAALLALPRRSRGTVAYMSAYALYALFLPVTTSALQAFPCETSAGVRFLAAAPYVPCDSPRLARLRVLAGVVLAVYCLPLLVTVHVVMRRSAPARARSAAARRSGDVTDRAAVPVALERLLLSSLRKPDTHWWWPLAYELGRGLALAMLVGLVPVTSALLPVGVFAVLAGCTLAYARAQPARHALDNALELAVLLAATLVYLINIVGGSAAARAEASGRSNPGADPAITTVVSLITLAMLVALVGAFAARQSASRLMQRLVNNKIVHGETSGSVGGDDADDADDGRRAYLSMPLLDAAAAIRDDEPSGLSIN